MVFRRKSLKVVLATALALGLANVGISPGFSASPEQPSAGNEEAGSTIVYWGVDSSGNYFETLPASGDDPANVGLTKP